MNRYRLWVAALALVAVALPATGCGSASTSTGDAALKASDINPQPRDKVTDGGVMRWAISDFPTQWNYFQLDGGLESAYLIQGALLPSAFKADDKAALSVNEDYVLSAKVTATSPKQVITYELNQKAKWSDGKPITIADYAANWKALRSETGPYLVSSTTGYEDVASVEQGKDEYEVVVTFKTPFSEWQSLFSPLMPASAMSTPEAFNKGWINRFPITAGPFKMEKIDRTAKSVTIARDPSWWGEPAKLDKIVYRTLDPDATVSAFANGEVDVADVGPDPSGYKRAQGVSGGSVREAGGPDFRHFTLNGTAPNLSDQKVRQAVTVGIDRAVITRADLTGLNWPTETLDNHYFVNTQVGYQDNTGDLGKYDPQLAGKLLDEAGWKLSGAYRQKDGRTLKLRFVIPAGVSTSKQEGELVLGMMKKIGIKLDLQTVPSDSFFDDYVIPGNFDITPFSWIGTPFPISSAESIYAKPTKDSSGELQIQQNFARIGTARIDRLMTEASHTLDPDKARDLLNEADADLWQLGHSLTLYQRPQITAVKASLANVGSFGFGTVVYEDIGFTK